MPEPIVAWSASFEVPAEPHAKPRHRTRVIKGKDGRTFAHNYPDAKGEKDEDTVISLAAPHAPPAAWDGPVALVLTFRMPVPLSRAAWARESALSGALLPTGKPDLDNLVKLFKDALTRSGRWWRDDAQVVSCDARKVYASAPATLVEVRFLRAPTREEWKADKWSAPLFSETTKVKAWLT